jgi:glutamate synthase (NADPH) small chain
MDRERVRRWEAQCIQEQPPACATTCPMHVDARQIAACVSRGDFRGGFAALAAALPLPTILAHICDHPCERTCRRSEAGDPVQIHALEKACATHGTSAAPQRTSSPRNQRVLIAGGVLSGVSAAILLARKGYAVTLTESGSALLGTLRGLGEQILPDSAITNDLAALDALGVLVLCNHAAPEESDPLRKELLPGKADAVFFADGTGPASLPDDKLTLATSRPGIFAGHGCQELSPISAVFEGSVAAISIDRFLQGASLTANRSDQGAYPSRLFVNISRAEPLPAVVAADPDRGYSREEAQREAGRCLPCECLECVRVCEYLKEYGSWPRRYIREIYNNECIVMGVRKSNRMINSCALCGLCTEVCPEKLSMADVCLDARRSMVERKRMPPSAHDFALRDMAFSASDAFTLARHQPGFAASRYAFLPGCQLSASAPGHVESCYAHLRNTLPDGIGLILACCGAPALWAGDEFLFRQTLNAMRSSWVQLGRPTLIAPCSSCFRVLHDYAPEIPVQSLWRHIDLTRLAPAASHLELALHDPCSSRGIAEVEDAARSLLRGIGVEVQELNERGLTTCCGFGGLVQFANPELADRTVARRAQQSAADYVTYCAMCRDRFAHLGKRATHILDLIFPKDADPAARPDPGFSRRQENRTRLRTRLLRELWGEQESAVADMLPLIIAPETHTLLEKRMILEDDIRHVIEHAEQSGEKLVMPASEHLLASWRSACVTYWVEYSNSETGYVVHNAYSHRMQVQ